MSLDLAIELAKRNRQAGLRYTLAAVICDRNRVISTGFNSYKKTHPLQARFGKNSESIFLHSELSAIVNAKHEDLEGKVMYIARVLKDGSTALAKPCSGCQRALIHFGFKDVIWTE